MSQQHDATTQCFNFIQEASKLQNFLLHKALQENDKNKEASALKELLKLSEYIYNTSRAGHVLIHSGENVNIKGPESVVDNETVINSLKYHASNSTSTIDLISDDTVTTSQDEGKRISPRPIIHTLDVKLQSNTSTSTSTSNFIACPPNARRPTPFETDVRLLICAL